MGVTGEYAALSEQARRAFLSDVDQARPRGGRMPRNARRAQLLESALEVFVAQGYHSAAMDDIAERAGVSKPVLYQHFPGKLELYLALLEQSSDRIIDATRAALASTNDNKLRVLATMQVFYDYVANAQGAFRLVFESDLTNEPAVRAQVDRVTNACADEITKVIHEDTGLPGEASRLLAVSLVGMAQVSARYWLDGPGEINRTEAAQLVASLAWRGISRFPLTDEQP
jgi:AcrR family transcriptional regulator